MDTVPAPGKNEFLTFDLLKTTPETKSPWVLLVGATGEGPWVVSGVVSGVALKGSKIRNSLFPSAERVIVRS